MSSRKKKTPFDDNIITTSVIKKKFTEFVTDNDDEESIMEASMLYGELMFNTFNDKHDEKVINDQTMLRNQEIREVFDSTYNSATTSTFLQCGYCQSDYMVNYVINEMVCTKCNRSVILPDMTKQRNYEMDEPHDSSNNKGYDPIRTLKKKLKDLCNISIVGLNQNMLAEVRDVLERRGLDPSNVLPKDIRAALKSIGYAGNYVDVPKICWALGNRDNLVLTDDQRNNIIEIFKKFLETYKKVKPSNRTNLIKYDHVIGKICELLDYDHVQQHLTKMGDTVLREHDKIWKEVCDENNWEYYPSV